MDLHAEKSTEVCYNFLVGHIENLALKHSEQTPRSLVPSRSLSRLPVVRGHPRKRRHHPPFKRPRPVKRSVASSSVVHRYFEKPAPEIPSCSWMCEYEIPEFNQAQVDFERVVSTDVEEHASDTRKLLIKLEVGEFGEPRESSDIVYVIKVVPIEDTQYDTTS
ncbi:hypothetical protein EVAR_103044_1 [Eumeta japonica]|uniref:Uncharacterized protein n=1 Tax=Eumeta variegata TaxID=151549 RepID=A0A4C1WE21_EUMVA|nr:hypothetical protein EVAR_103044_1 [Eumeta japonica]